MENQMERQENIGFRSFREWRKMLQISQEQAAYLLGIKRIAYQRRESRNKPIHETRYAMIYLVSNPQEVAERLKDFTSMR